MKKLVTLAVILSIAFLTVISAFAMADPSEPSQGTASDYPISKGVMQQMNISDPQPVNLYFYGGDGGELKTDLPVGNQTTDVPCPGSPLPRAFGLLVGIWTTPEISTTISVEALISVSIWARSDQGANNVRFTVQILVNGNQIMDDIGTNSQSLSGTPSEFIGDGSGSQIELNPGDTIAARLYYFADSQVVIGPAPDSTMLVGGSEFDTHITITTAPISISVNEPIIIEDIVTFSATYADAFGSTKLNAMLNVNGKSDVTTLSEPSFTPGINGSSVAWGWNYKADEAQEGEYTVSVTLSYGEDNGFTATGIYMIEFPKEEKDEGFFGSIGWLLPIIILVIVIVVIIITARKILERRALKRPA